MQTQQEVGRILGRYGAAVDQEIRAELGLGLDDWLRNMLEYHFGWRDEQFEPVAGGNSGKKLRPVMALLAYQGALESQNAPYGSAMDIEPALPLAAALEMIHNYSLIHDDIEDQDRTRRGRPTLWAVWGEPKAINAGDCLNMLAFRRLLRSGERGVSPDRMMQLVTTVTDTCIQLTVGQDADMSFEQNLAVTPQMYLDMIGGKTAALIRCATYGGALLALDPPQHAEQLAAYARFGEQIGLGFQIRDDILGIWGLTADTGKHSGSDIRRRKKSLPIIYAFSNVTARYRERLLDLYRRNDLVTPADEQFVMEVLDECEAQAYVQQQADQYKHAALTALETAAGGPAALASNSSLRQLGELCTFLVERNY